uniref:RRM domain-containing protein n=1 Tax=Tetraselmis chuii TaxID=63592 RepID=A0A7S1X0U7_9CHLO|mmetsp:Transcript_19108/g.34047  ORF Transcript_19108/g.34047 Transcript_19108/m.34047 type:complete len:230 (+) Transcript_19108:290-979(+)|eukprot:CAMPEP_0177763142 /NCGR_PEP_ID=MMETSP0491_2-20121128/6716_1 /TAXON_ID=63592 /ORGANISM="Tetraselmis chuii, Strain PLY429" /LENGTH=229 /DNA_ID=CAMNT_0019279235 /DNA_START=282 /DNA_END=971 /DNA_ORIENTATION=-
MADTLPNQTLYINNLYEKAKKEELKKCMYALFSQYGKVLDVVAMKTLRLRGQCWVVFEDVGAATSAMRSLQGFPFYNKPMRIAFAKTKSDAVAKMDGSFKEKDKKAQQEHNKEAREALLAKAKEKQAAKSATAEAAAAAGAPPPEDTERNPPHNILFVQNLPQATNSQMLSMLFQQFPGFKEVRMVDARPGIGFVEFENDLQASVALSGLQGFKITPTHPMAVSYAKQG